MSDNKKYYYLKLKENFYDTEEMILLQNMRDGYMYSDILMKLYLRSLKSEGKLMFKDVIPYTPTILAQVVRHQVGTVEKALDIFQKFGLVEILDDGAIYMSDIQNFIGESSTEADRIRAYRTKIKTEELKCTNVQLLNDKSTPEIEKEIELKKELNINSTSAIVHEVIRYLNEKIKTNYRETTDKTKKQIQARLKEGYTLEDFKKVIDNKIRDWYRNRYGEIFKT